MYCECQLVDLQTSKFFHGVRSPIVNLSSLTIGLLFFFISLTVKVLDPQAETSDVMRSPLKKELFSGQSMNLHVLELIP